jgi:hypothetical protein
MEAATEEAKLVQERDVGSHSASSAIGGEEAAPAPDAREVHQVRGEGIGLSIVKRLCELLDAAIELDTTPNVGTTFRVVFPAPLRGRRHGASAQLAEEAQVGAGEGGKRREHAGKRRRGDAKPSRYRAPYWSNDVVGIHAP